jgi:MFS family permease
MARNFTSLGRSFNGLWFSTGSANLADGMALFALPLLALGAGASPGGVAAVTMVLTMAWPVFGLHAGWIVDRVPRRPLMAGVNLIRAALLAALAVVAATGQLSLSVVLLAAALIGIAETLVDTALTATVPLVVEPDRRTRANARIEATINVANQLVGPPLAGALAGVALALTVGTSALLYALAVAGIAVMTLHRPAPSAGSTDVGAGGAGTVPGTVTAPGSPTAAGTGLTAGLRFVWRQTVIRALTVFTALMNLVWGVAIALLVVYAVAPGPLGLSPARYGFMLTAMAAGGLLAAVLVEPLSRRVGVTRLLVIDCVGTVLLVAPVALGTTAWLVAAGMVIAGAGASVWRILVATIRQNLTPSVLLGRVYAASRVVSWGALPVGAGLGGVGAELWGVRPVFAVASVLAVGMLAAFIPFAVRHDLSAALGADRRPTVPTHPSP